MKTVVTIVVALPLLAACGALIGVKDLVAPPEAEGGPVDGPERQRDAADAMPDGAATTCGDTVGSGDDCGRCGHSCLGGQCLASVCQPVTLAKGQGEVWGVALDATYVYYASYTGGFVARVPKAGGPVETISASAGPLARRLAVDATSVYWTSDDGPGAVSRCPLAGCSGAPAVLATPYRPQAIALDPTAVYWADRNSSTLRRRPLGGGAEETYATSTVGLPQAVAVDHGALFWLGDFTGRVEGRAADGGTFAVGVNGTSGRDLVLDATFVYWGAAVDPGDEGRITRAPRSGAGPTAPIGMANGEPMALAVDGARVYWTAQRPRNAGDPPADGVYACPLTGCDAAAPPLAPGEDLPRGIAVDDDALYWGANGVVKKLAKP